MSDRSAERALSPARRERKDVSLRFMLALLALIAAVLLLLLGLSFVIFPGEMQDRRFAQPFPSFPAPRLQPNPALDWTVFHAQEMAKLNSAGWQDRTAGSVHIPIEQAMRAVATEGIKGWPSGSTTASQGDRR